MAWAIVCPASRGIGLALTRQLLLTTPVSLPVVATARHDLAGTKERILSTLPEPARHVARLDVQHCDVTSDASIAALAAHCREHYQADKTQRGAHLRLALFVPGQLVPERAPDKIEAAAAAATLTLNLLAPLLLVKHFAGFLPRKSTPLDAVPGLHATAAVLALMSARVGSIADNRAGGWYSYRASKAGVNQLARTLDQHLRVAAGPNAMSIALHPGTVKTELSRQFWASTPTEKLFSPEFAAERLLDVIKGLGVEEARGACWDWKGERIPP